MNKYKRLGKNTFYVFIGNAGSKLLIFLMLPFYTKWLSPEDYGEYDLLLVYTSILINIITLSLSEAVFVLPKGKSKTEQRSFFSSALLLSLALLVISFLILYYLNSFWTNAGVNNVITYHFVYFYSIIITTFLQSFLQQFARSIDEIKTYAYSGLILVISVVITSFLLIPQYGLNGYFTSQILSFSISSIFTFFAIKAYQYLKISDFSVSTIKQMLRYSIPLVPNGIMWWLVSSLNRPLINQYVGTEAVGLFAVANKFPSILILIFNVFMYSWQISVMEEYGKDNFQLFYNKIFRYIMVIMVLFIIILSLGSQFIFTTLLDDNYYSAWKLVPILSLSVIFSSISGLSGTVFSATLNSKYYFYSSLWGALSSIVLNILLIPYFGLIGASISVVLSFFTMAISRLYFSRNFVKFTEINNIISLVLISIGIVLSVLFCKTMILSLICHLTLITVFFLINRKLFRETISSVKLFIHKN